jgi:preprotein translocase subunit SecF
LKGENEMNVKEFWRKHKKRIFIVGGTIVVGTVVFLITKDSKYKLNFKDKKVIWWKDEDNSFMDIERVKAILDANKDNSSSFAIFREGPNPNEYVTILLSDDVVLV